MENYEFWVTIARIVLAAVAIIGFVSRGQENLRKEIREEMHALNTRISSLEMRISNLEQRVARLEGLFEGLRDMFRQGKKTKDD